MKKIFLLFYISVLMLCGCSRSELKQALQKNDVKVGFVYINSIDDNGYTQAHDRARLAVERLGIRTLYVENVPENSECEIAMRELIQLGCTMIYATSYGYGPYVMKVAADYPKVKFAHCSGGLTSENVSCYFARAYEARYLAGIVAGLKTSSNKIGYVAAYPVPECKRAINAFVLGVRSVNPDASVYVRWSNSWNNPIEDKYQAENLLGLGCDVLTQHLDSLSAQLAAEKKGAFFIGDNSPSSKVAQKSYLTAVCFCWEKFVLEDVVNFIGGKWQSRFYWEGLEKEAVVLDDLSELCEPGTRIEVEKAKKGIISGDFVIFKGPLYDNENNLRVDENKVMTSYEIWNMDWIIDGVVVN